MSKTGKKMATQQQEPINLLMALKEAQCQYGYLSQELITELADSLHLPLNYIYGVASFYSFLALKPQGRNIIKICRSLPCYLKNGQTIVDAVAREIGIKPGQATPDRRFSFELTNCIGLCDGSPAMMINNDAHTNLTEQKIAQILQNYQ
jgi:NADH:ubiquinone oxidoreductase subunit E